MLLVQHNTLRWTLVFERIWLERDWPNTISTPWLLKNCCMLEKCMNNPKVSLTLCFNSFTYSVLLFIVYFSCSCCSCSSNFSRGWDWWAKRYNGYVDFLFTFLMAELQFHGRDDWSQYIFWVQFYIKPDIKNGKVWIEDILAGDPASILGVVGALTVILYNYYGITRELP